MAKKKGVGIGVIGAGGIAQAAHLPGYQKDARARILAVADIRKEAAQEAAKRFSIPHVFTDYHDLLQMPEIDAVSVCTPNYLHKQPTVDALKAGKHVIVEKPLAINAKEGRAMVEAARRNGRKLFVGLQNRFHPAAQALKRMIEAGDLGEIYYARAQALRRRGIPGWGNFIEKDKAGGGPLIDIGVHILDLTLYLMGHPHPLTVSGVTYCKFGRKKGLVGLLGQWDPKKYTVEDFGVGFVRFDNGATLTLEASFAANLENDVFATALMGTEGGASLYPLKVFTEKNQTLLNIEPAHLPSVNTYEAEIAAFLDCVVNDTPPLVSGEQALVATEILEGIYRSADLGREVKIAGANSPMLRGK